jgi:glycosyltransferase involved in cell wall biosynthesis
MGRGLDLRRLRILHVSGGLGPNLGGPSRAVREMCAAIAARGHQVTLFSTNLNHRGYWSPLRSPRLLDVPTNVPLREDGYDLEYFPVRWPTRFSYAPSMVPALREAIADADVVHIHSLYLFTSMVAARVARRLGIPYLVRPHGTLDPYLRRRHRWRKAALDLAFQRRDLNLAAAIHYTSEEESDLARPLRLRAPALVVRHGFDASELRHLPATGDYRRSHPGLSDADLVVFLGRITPKKGIDILLSAFAVVAADHPRARLVVAGPDDEGHGDQVRALVYRLGLEERVHMPGMLLGRAKLELLAAAQVWVLPSHGENFGVAVVEAMACGLPVVITDRVAIHDQVTKAGAGLVVGLNAGEVARAIAAVLDDPGLGRRLGKAGASLVRERFSWDVAAADLERAYISIARGAGT